MRRFLIFLLTLVSVLIGTAQNVKSENVFHTYIYNDEYKVYMDVNLYDANISVPGQDVFGMVPGFFGALRDSRKWLVTDAKIVGKSKAKLEKKYLKIRRRVNEDKSLKLTEIPANEFKFVWVPNEVEVKTEVAGEIAKDHSKKKKKKAPAPISEPKEKQKSPKNSKRGTR